MGEVCTNFWGEFYTAKHYMKFTWAWVHGMFIYELKLSDAFTTGAELSSEILRMPGQVI
jgi:hypothetical protein